MTKHFHFTATGIMQYQMIKKIRLFYVALILSMINLGLSKQPQSVWGLTPLNDAQRCAVDALLDENIKLITLIGGAGTGKTLLALAAGLRLVFDKPLFKKILVSRPVIPLGRIWVFYLELKKRNCHLGCNRFTITLSFFVIIPE